MFLTDDIGRRFKIKYVSRFGFRIDELNGDGKIRFEIKNGTPVPIIRVPYQGILWTRRHRLHQDCPRSLETECIRQYRRVFPLFRMLTSKLFIFIFSFLYFNFIFYAKSDNDYSSTMNSVSSFGMPSSHIPPSVGPPTSMMSSSPTFCLQQRDSYSCMGRDAPTYEPLGMSPYWPLKPPVSSCSPVSHNTYHNMNGHQYNGASGWY